MRFYQQHGWTRNDRGEFLEIYIVRPTNGLFCQGVTILDCLVSLAVVAGLFVTAIGWAAML